MPERKERKDFAQEKKAKDRKNVAEVTREEKGTNDRAQSSGLLPVHISVLMTIIIQRIC